MQAHERFRFPPHRRPRYVLLSVTSGGRVILWTWATLACVGPDPDSPDVTGPTGPTETEGGLVVELLENAGNPLSMTARVQADTATAVTFAYGTSDTLDRRTPVVTVGAGEAVEIPILGLYPDTWQIAPLVDGKEGPRWTVTPEWPEGVLDTEIEAPGGPFSEEEAFCTAREAERPAYVCTDRQGRPTFYAALPFNAMFVRPLSDGTFLAHPDGGDGVWQFDVRGQEVRGIIELDELQGDLTYEHGWIDEHESLEILEGPWAGAWAILTAIDGDDRIGAGIVVFDPDTRSVLWDWSSLGRLGDGESIDESKLPFDRWGVIEHGDDWLHANAVIHGTDAQGDYFWMSLRHQDWIIEIRAPSGDISWRLGRGGDFELVGRPERDWFYHQHAPEMRRLDDGTISVLVFDNGNGRPGVEDPESRGVEMRLDRAAKTAEITLDIAPGYFSPAAGDADRMPDDSAILLTRAVGRPEIREIARDGTTRWSQRLFDEGEVYRGEYYPSLYERTWSMNAGW